MPPPSTQPFVTAGALSDGTVCDVVEEAPGALRLVRWDGSHLSGPVQALCLDGRTYCVPEFDGSWLHACRFPSQVGDSLESSKLWADLCTFGSDYLRVDEETKCLIFAFVFASWFADVLPWIPTLWAAGPEPTDRMNVLRLLHYLCRRPVLLTDCRPNTLLAVPSELQPTVLAPIQGSLKVTTWLESGLYRGFHVLRGGSLKSIPYAKGLVSYDFPPTSAPLLEIALPPNSVRFPVHFSDGLAKVASDLQANFLRYRLENYRRVATAQFNPSGFSSPGMGQLAACLASCFDAEDIRQEVMKALAPADRRQRLERAADLHAIALEALLVACHEQKPEMLVGELAEVANSILAGRVALSQAAAAWFLTPLPRPGNY